MDTHLNFIKDATLDAATDIEAVSRFIIEQASEKPDFSNSVAVDFLHAVGLLSFSYMFARIAAAAKYKSGEFYQNKLTLAHYFVQRILPELSMRIAKINAGSDLVMEFSEEFFTSQS